MDIITLFTEFVLHLDQNINILIATFGPWTYVILFAVIFCETGLVVAPFLPGDSLLFAAGAFAALGSLDFALLFVSLAAAAIIGDTVNYWLGHYVGPKVFTKKNVRFMNKEHLERAHRFYEKYGGKTIVLARFIPIIRTFAPFVAGIGAMNYRRFIVYNILGAVAWVAVFLTGGYLFGNIQVVRDNFALVMIAIIAISFAPLAFELIRRRLKAKGKKSLKNRE
ncbi:MAG: DedA family protein [Candidatus Aenigmarchaeota archaeon]|nr:DedA family protein [Candidatus Aenigmarchaeota archaeon]